MHFLPLRALDVQHGRLQHALERPGLFGLALVPALELLDAFVEILVELLAQSRQIGAAALQDALAFAIVRERVEQVLERQIRMPPRHRLAVGNRQHDFDGGGEHDPIMPYDVRRRAGVLASWRPQREVALVLRRAQDDPELRRRVETLTPSAQVSFFRASRRSYPAA